MAKKKFDSNKAVQPIYTFVNEVIKDLSHDDAIAVLEEVSAHADAMIEGIEADKKEAEGE